MDRYAFPPEYVAAGREYLTALKKLGLRPEALLWGYDEPIRQFVLVLVTGQVDRVGPTEVYRLLTEAYNLSGTPKEISPFIIRLHSPRQGFFAALSSVYKDAKKMAEENPELLIEFPEGISTYPQMPDLMFHVNWVLAFDFNHNRLRDRDAEWEKFRRNVSKLAA